MEPRVREIATGILKSASPTEGMDMITDFSDPFPGDSDCGNARDSCRRSEEIQKVV